MRHLIAPLAVLAALTTAACSPQDSAAPATAEAPAPPAAMTEDSKTTQASLMDTKGNQIAPAALAGTFVEAESELVLLADGSYRQTLTTAGAQLSSDGIWIPAGRASIALTPIDKAGETVRFTLVSVDDMRSQDGLHHFKRKQAP